MREKYAFILYLLFALFFLVNSILSGHTISIVVASLLFVFVIGLFLIHQKEGAKENESNKKRAKKDSFQWKYSVCLIIGILGVLFGPWLFTHPYPFDMHSLDFSQTGAIGDTIGGITAPIVGLVSILLLWWTLKEQLAFNEEQKRINTEQKKFNDADSILSMETHILHMDENLHFGLTNPQRTIRCTGISELKRLVDGTINDVGISSSELEKTVDRVHIIETAILSLISFLDKSCLEIEEKKASYCMAEMYLSSICDFYSNIVTGKVKTFLSSIAELHSVQIGEKRQDERIVENCSAFIMKIMDILPKCQQRVNDSN